MNNNLTKVAGYIKIGITVLTVLAAVVTALTTGDWTAVIGILGGGGVLGGAVSGIAHVSTANNS